MERRAIAWMLVVSLACGSAFGAAAGWYEHEAPAAFAMVALIMSVVCVRILLKESPPALAQIDRVVVLVSRTWRGRQLYDVLLYHNGRVVWRVGLHRPLLERLLEELARSHPALPVDVHERSL